MHMLLSDRTRCRMHRIKVSSHCIRHGTAPYGARVSAVPYRFVPDPVRKNLWACISSE